MGKHFLWDPVEDNIVKEIDDSGTTIADYTTEPYLYGDLISQHRGGQSSFYHYDGQGSTTSLTDSSANVTDTYAYSAFGEVTSHTGSTVNPFQYVGQKQYYRDEETGEYEVRRRCYATLWARWLSIDVILSDHNAYRMSKGNPVGFIDPSGLNCEPLTCCSCADKLTFKALDDLKPGSDVSACFGTPKHTGGASYGNEFLIAVQVSKKKYEPESPLVVFWWEQLSKQLTDPAGKVIITACDKPVDMFEIEGSERLITYKRWVKDEAAVECPGEATVFLRDCPFAALRKPEDQRLLCIKLEILSACPDCKAKKLEYYVKQECFIDKAKGPKCVLSHGDKPQCTKADWEKYCPGMVPKVILE